MSSCAHVSPGGDCHSHFRAPGGPECRCLSRLGLTSHSEFTLLPTVATVPSAQFQLVLKQLWHFSGGWGYSSVESVSFENAVFGRKTLFTKKNTILLMAPWNQENESETEKASPTRHPALGGSEVQHPASRQPPTFSRVNSFHFFRKTKVASFFGITEKEVKSGFRFLNTDSSFKEAIILLFLDGISPFPYLFRNSPCGLGWP